MSKETYIEGDSIEWGGGTTTEYVGKWIYSSDLKLLVTAANNKFFGSNPDDFPKREGTRVKSIECVTPLDDGSRNDGLRINLQKGIVFGKTYEFRVKEFTNEESVNPDDIKWAISYTDVETGVYENNNLKEVATGDIGWHNFGWSP